MAVISRQFDSDQTTELLKDYRLPVNLTESLNELSEAIRPIISQWSEEKSSKKTNLLLRLRHKSNTLPDPLLGSYIKGLTLEKCLFGTTRACPLDLKYFRLFFDVTEQHVAERRNLLNLFENYRKAMSQLEEIKLASSTTQFGTDDNEPCIFLILKIMLNDKIKGLSARHIQEFFDKHPGLSPAFLEGFKVAQPDYVGRNVLTLIIRVYSNIAMHSGPSLLSNIPYLKELGVSEIMLQNYFKIDVQNCKLQPIEIQRKLINQERLREELEMKYHSERTKSMAKDKQIQRKLINQERLREELEMKYHSERTKSMAKDKQIQRKLINQERLREELEMKYHSEKTKSMAKDKQIAELTNEKNEYQNKLMAMYRQEDNNRKLKAVKQTQYVLEDVQQKQETERVNQDRTWCQLFTEGLEKQAIIRLNMVSCVVTGAEGSGKSCLIDCITNALDPVSPNPTAVRLSSYLANANKCYFEKSTVSGMKEHLAGVITTENYTVPLSIQQDQSLGSSRELNVPVTCKIQDNTEDPMVKGSRAIKPSTTANERVAELDETFEQFCSEGPVTSISDFEVDRYIHFFDIGGHRTLSDAIPLILPPQSNLIYVHKSSECLSQPSCPPDRAVSRSMAMQQSFASAYTSSIRSQSLCKETMPPCQIIVVGTYKDHLDGKEEKSKKELQDKKAMHIDLLKKKPYCDRLSCFTVNSKTPDAHIKKSADDQKSIDDLRHKVIHSGSFSVDIPFPWLCLQLITKMHESKFLKVDDLMRFSIKRKLIRDEAEMMKMLTQFHNLGFYVCFHQEAADVVCTDPALFYDEIISKLLVPVPNSSSVILDGFRKTGVFFKPKYQELFNVLGIPESVPPEWLLNVLLCSGLAAHIPRSDDIIVPSVLPDCTAVIPEGTVDDICFTIKFGASEFTEHNELPRNLFPMLIAHLIETSQWKVLPEASDRSTFKFRDSPFWVYIKESPGRIQVQINSQSGVEIKEIHEKCCAIHKKIHESLDFLIKKSFGRGFLEGQDSKGELKVGVCCQVCDSLESHIAPVIPSAEIPEFLCCSGTGSTLSDARKAIWFNNFQLKDGKFKEEKVELNVDCILQCVKDVIPPKLQDSESTGTTDHTTSLNQEQVKRFLENELQPWLEYLNFKIVVSNMQSKKIIDNATFRKLQDKDCTETNDIVYHYLLQDPSSEKLGKLAQLLIKEEGHDNNKYMAKKITKFLKSLQ